MYHFVNSVLPSTNFSSVGHGAKRCKEPPKEEAAGDGFDSATGGGGFDNGGFDAAPSGGEAWNTGTDAGGDSTWATTPATATAGGGGGW